MSENLDDSGVGHFFSRLNPAGAELRTIDVVDATGLRFDFVALSGAKGSLDDSLVAKGHGVFHIRMSVGGARPLYSLMKRRKYRVVHSHLGVASGFVLAIAFVAGVPIRVAHFRSDGVGGKPAFAKKVLVKVSSVLVGLFATDVVGVSPGALEGSWKRNWRDDRRAVVIANGLDYEALRVRAATSRAQRGDAVERLIVVNVGRVEETKNRGRAIRIWQEVARTRPSTLLLVGQLNAADERQVELTRATLGADSEIVVFGDVTDVPVHYGSAHVLLVTSTREGLPGVVLEALATGVAVVSSALPGSIWIAGEVDGVTIRELDQPDDEWASAVVDAGSGSSAVIESSFERGPFVLAKIVPEFARLWKLPQKPAAPGGEL